MKKITLIIFALLFMSSCTRNSYFKYNSIYTYAKQNPNQDDRIGYKDKVCTISIKNPPIDCKIDLLDHNNKCEYVVIHSIDVKRGEDLEMFIKGEYLDVEIHIHEFTYFMSGQYFYGTYEVSLNPYIKEAFEKFNIYNDNL